MSLSGGRSSGWEGLEIQQVSILQSVFADELPLTDKIGFTKSIDPAGGLDRRQVAELVAMRVFGVFAFVTPDSGVGTTPGNADHGYEVSMEDSPKVLGPIAQARAGAAQVAPWSAGELGDPANNFERFVDINDPDVLMYATPHNFQAFNDTVNGTGGGATMHMNHQHFNFREELGGGPELDQHDKVYFHCIIGEHEVADENIVLYAQQQLIWDLREV